MSTYDGKLSVEGELRVHGPTTQRMSELLPSLLRVAKKHNVQLVASTDETGLFFRLADNTLAPGDEEEFLAFLAEIGREFGGAVSGELEAWWPMCVSAGPQWWTLEENGKLFITESDIVRGEKKPYEVSDEA